MTKRASTAILGAGVAAAATCRTFSLPVELGASLIHGRDSETVHILRAMNATSYLVDGEHGHLKDGQLGKCNDVWAQLDKLPSKLEALDGAHSSRRIARAARSA
jgi:hypothetical protein